jgi:hypothetical protein
VQVVLEGSSRNQKPGPGVEDPDDLRKHRVDVLDTVGLVDDDVLPGELLEGGLLAEAELVRGDEDVEGLGKDLGGDNFGLRRRDESVRVSREEDWTYPLFLPSLEEDDVESRDPVGKLPGPVVERTLGDDDEVRTVDLLVELEVTQERDRLERLSKSL